VTGSDESQMHEATLATERAVNELYLSQMAEAVRRQVKAAKEVPLPRNNQWTSPGSESKIPIRKIEVDPLIGRVALDVDDALLGSGFYIGSWHQEIGDTQVVSWAAPVATLFYLGRSSGDVLASEVEGRRTFVTETVQIVDFVDDLEETGTGSEDPFATPLTGPLDIPAAPAFVIPTPPSAGSPADPVGPVEVVEEPESPRVEVADESTEARPPCPDRFEVEDGLRAEKALLRVLDQPRTGKLSSVLATLQPDQYRLVTWPQGVPLIVQGSPGTGKTIVAVHRASYLVHPERDGGSVGPVAIVGPTERFVDHVSKAVRDLDVSSLGPEDPGGRIQIPQVLSVAGLLGRLAGVDTRAQLLVDDNEERIDTDWRLMRFATQAVGHLRAGGCWRHDFLVR